MMARKGMLEEICLNDKRFSAQANSLSRSRQQKKSNILIVQDQKIQETELQPSKTSPIPFQQTKISRTNQNLNQIPIPFRPELIQQLYLSHNLIKSVQYKLRCFPNLRNLNLSYNYLHNVIQFISEINGDKEESKLPLKMLYIRMNQFDYGYQDQIVNKIKSLEVFEDFYFCSKPYPQIRGQKIYENSKQIELLSSRIGDCLLVGYTNLNQAIIQLTQLHKSFIGNSRIQQITNENIKSRYEKIISKLSAKIQPIKQKAYLPTPRMKVLQNISQYLIELLDIQVKDERGKQHLKLIRNNFKQLVKQILIKFSNRNYRQLINSLRKWIKAEKNQKIQDLQQLVDIFGIAYNARKYSIFEPLPGKYIEKINPMMIKQHPLIDYLEVDRRQEAEKQDRANEKTLDGDRRRCRNTVIRNLGAMKEQTNSIFEDQIFQRMPIFVYQRNYLQVLTQILNQKVGKLIRIYDYITRIGQAQQIKNKFQEQNGYLKNQLNCNIYIKQNDSLSINQEPLTEGIKIPKKIKQMKIKSKQKNKKISFQRLQTIKQIPQSEKNSINNDGRATVKRQYVLNNDEDRTKSQITGKRSRRKRKYKDHRDNDFIQVKSELHQKEIPQNLDKFSLYQINLAYKVFHILKMRVQTKRKTK